MNYNLAKIKKTDYGIYFLFVNKYNVENIRVFNIGSKELLYDKLTKDGKQFFNYLMDLDLVRISNQRCIALMNKCRANKKWSRK